MAGTSEGAHAAWRTKWATKARRREEEIQRHQLYNRAAKQAVTYGELKWLRRCIEQEEARLAAERAAMTAKIRALGEVKTA